MVRPDFDFLEIDLRIWDFARLGGVQVLKLTVITLCLEGFWCQKYENRGISVFCPKTVVGVIKSSQEPPDMVKPDFDFPKIDLKSWILAQNLVNF